ncbi:hypothetical protein ACFZCG_37135 [Streptomyces tanashiensis]|uniref:hypothetical protein n=1 Tax=Streptomyces tanashiensis TaxID=67367 RepID=UPI0036F149E4
MVDERGRTSIPEVRAAGNMTGPQEQMADAVNRGHRAGGTISDELPLTDPGAAADRRPAG